MDGNTSAKKHDRCFTPEATNVGSHRSVPLKNNAIYHLADGLSRLGEFDFPFKLSETARAYFQRRAVLKPPAMGADMRAMLREPPDAAARPRRGELPHACPESSQ